MSVDLIKLQKDLTKMRDILKEYTAIFKASDGVDFKEQKELNQMQNKIDLIENKIQELLDNNSLETNNPAVVAFENKWRGFIQTLEEGIAKYGLNIPE